MACPNLLLCTTDRRLTGFGRGEILTERSTKLLTLECADAKALITYNGIGVYRDETPVDWLLDLNERARLSGMSYADVLNTIRDDTERRIAALPGHVPRRHTFVLAAVRSGTVSIHVISNYESAKSEGSSSGLRDHFSISGEELRPGKDIIVLVTGATTSFRHRDGKAIVRLAKESAEPTRIKNRCAKAIKGAAFRQNRRGTIGTSVAWTFMTPSRSVEGGLDVIGGTTMVELPSQIGRTAMFKDGYVEAVTVGSEFRSRFDPAIGKFSFPERPCPRPACPGRLPPGYRECPVCGARSNGYPW